MSRNEFEDWLKSLPIQTLTDELKETIWDNAEDMVINEVINSR